MRIPKFKICNSKFKIKLPNSKFEISNLKFKFQILNLLTLHGLLGRFYSKQNFTLKFLASDTDMYVATNIKTFVLKQSWIHILE